MDQLKRLLASLSGRQKITILLAAVLVGGSLVAFTRWRRERDFRPLYSGLAPEDAGPVVQKLRESGVEYRLGENGGTVLVPSARVAEVRLQMASAGLPKSGRLGFEIFDKTNFGATDFTEHINYRRALEGELERSIMCLTEVEQARVHITFPKDSVFLEARQQAKASVLVRLKSGARLAPQSTQAICQLVASAVEGLSPEAVAVVDMNGNLLNRARRQPGPESEEASEATLEFKQKLERDLLAKINSTLEPLLGPEKFRAGVSAECDFSSGEQSEEVFDPTRSVMVTAQKSEDVSGSNMASGVPGTASSLPRPTSRPGSAGLGVARRTENISYQATRTVRRMRIPQGTIKRLSIAVLVDQNVRWEGTGPRAKRILEPPPPEKLKVIRDLVAAAAGFSTERGDQLIVESLPFETTLTLAPPEPEPTRAPPAPPHGWMERIKGLAPVLGAVAALLMALLAALFLAFRKRRPRDTVHVRPALPPGEGQPSAESPEVAGAALEARLAEQAALKQQMETEAINALKLPPVTTKRTEVLTKHLGETAKKDPAAAAQILRSWLYEMES